MVSGRNVRNISNGNESTIFSPTHNLVCHFFTVTASKVTKIIQYRQSFVTVVGSEFQLLNR